MVVSVQDAVVCTQVVYPGVYVPGPALPCPCVLLLLLATLPYYTSRAVLPVPTPALVHLPGRTAWAQRSPWAWVGLPDTATLPKVVTVLRGRETGVKAA